jgi:glycosyltransferase involved in cell wall biosynthesis
VGDIPAVLGDTGVLVPPGDVKMLINAIFSLLENTEKRAKLGTAAHQRFLAHFTLSHLREQLLTCYTELVC